MATSIVANDVLEHTIYTQADEQLGVNVCHYRVSGVTGLPTYEQLVTLMSARIASPYKDWLADGAGYAGCKLRLLAGPTSPAPWFSTEDFGAGTAGDFTPRQLAGLIRKRVNFAGPKGRGRFYAAFAGDTMFNGPVVGAAGLTVLGEISDTLFNGAAPLTLVPAVGTTVTLVPGILLGGTGNIVTDLTSAAVSGEIATQKRRGFYGRPNSLPGELV